MDSLAAAVSGDSVDEGGDATFVAIDFESFDGDDGPIEMGISGLRACHLLTGGGTATTFSNYALQERINHKCRKFLFGDIVDTTTVSICLLVLSVGLGFRGSIWRRG